MERMWNNKAKNAQPQAATYAQRLTKSEPPSPAKPVVVNAVRPSRAGSFHALHKVPLGDSPYDKAKQMQLMNKDPERAIALFWAAINAGDKVDSALKDMAITMKQQNRSEEAIEAIISLRNKCSTRAQESLDNILLDLYKRCGRLEDQIKLLKRKLNLIHMGLAFNGKKTKTARSQGKKFRVTIEHEVTRLLGNLGWAYMQQSNYIAAEAVYRKALYIEPDDNRTCNLSICLIHQGRVAEAKSILQSVTPASSTGSRGTDSHLRSYERAQEMLREVETKSTNHDSLEDNSFVEFLKPSMGQSLQCPWKHSAPNQSEHEMTNSDLGDWEMITFHATSGFALSQQEFSLADDKSFQSSMFDNAWIEDKIEEDGFGDENLSTISSVSASSQGKATTFKFPQKPQTQQSNVVLGDQSSMSDNAWIEEDDFGDENININNIGSVSASSQSRATTFKFPQKPQTQQSNVNVLRQRLEKVCLKENASVKHSAFLPLNSSYREQSGLNSAAAPFFSKYANQRDGKSTFSNGLESNAGFEERVPLMFDRVNEQRNNSFEERALAPIGNGFTRNTTKSENTYPVHQNKVLGSFGSASTRSIVKSENRNPVHQKRVLGSIGSGSTRNKTKSENTNPVHQRAFLGQSSPNQNKPTTKHFLSFESVGSGLESTGSGLDLPPLPTKKTMTMTNNKDSMTLPMQEKNAAADPCDSLGFIRLPDTLEFEQALVSWIYEAANSDQAAPTQEQTLQSRLQFFQDITLNAHPNA